MSMAFELLKTTETLEEEKGSLPPVLRCHQGDPRLTRCFHLRDLREACPQVFLAVSGLACWGKLQVVVAPQLSHQVSTKES